MIGTIIVIALVVIAALVVLAIVLRILHRRPHALRQDHFQKRWKELQKMLADKASWSAAVLDADTLLDEALKKKHIPGTSMGERLVKAQRDLSDNDGVWYGHKLRSKIESEKDFKLKEADVKQALLGIRQALKDLGALPSGKQSQEDKSA